MPTYTCKKCRAIRIFEQAHAYELAALTCDNCQFTQGWAAYTGEMWEQLLRNEDQEASALAPQIRSLSASVENHDLRLAAERSELAKLARTYKDQAKVSAQELATYNDRRSAMLARINEIADRRQGLEARLAEARDKLEDLGNRKTIVADSRGVYGNAQSVRDSGKNRLYIGSRQYVGGPAVLKNDGKTVHRRKRILDANNWSPGLNVAWVEGGINAKAHFKLKMDPENRYRSIPRQIIDLFAARQQIGPEEFYEICSTQGRGTLLWYDAKGKDRPSWTAMEIFYLLRSGYAFNVVDRGTAGEKVYLIPPP